MKARKGEIVLLDSLSEATRYWLGRRGFKTTEDINELVTIGGGSLGQPLHNLYCVLRFVCSKIPLNQPQFFQSACKWLLRIRGIQIQRRHTSTPALVRGKLIQEILDDIALHTLTKEENEKEMGDLSSDTEIDMYFLES